jgi:hypothetical protein
MENQGAGTATPSTGAQSTSTPTSSGYSGAVGQTQLSDPGTKAGSNESAQTQAPGAEVKATPRTYKLKIDGQEIEASEDEVIKRAQLASSASKRFEEATKLKADVDSRNKKFKENLIEALQDPALGLSKDQIREQFEGWYRKEFIEPSTLTPEQRRIKELEEKNSQYETQRQTIERQAEEAKHAEETKQWTQTWQQRIIEGMTKAELPNDELSMALIAQQLMAAREAGVEVPTEAAASLVKEKLTKMTKHFLGKLDGEQLIKFVGEEIINKIRKADLARLRAGQVPQADPAVRAAQPKQGSNPQLMQTNKVVKMDKVRNYFDNLK